MTDQGPGSLSTLVDQFLDAKSREPDTPAHLANVLCCLARFRAAEACSGWHKAGNRLSVSSNQHLFSLLDQIEQLAEPVFRVECADLFQSKLLARLS